jgi:hypothetical protein
MSLETTQILCSAYYFTDQIKLSPYKLTHPNHPCCLWVRESVNNWIWLRELGLELCKEYTYRYGKIHKCEGIIRSMIVPNLPNIPITPFKCAMDDIYKVSDSTIDNYRNYYNKAKQHLFEWKNRQMPEWISM